MKALAIVQARTSSTRLPNKILKQICGRSMLELQLDRLNRAKKLDEIIVATTNSSTDDSLVALLRDTGHQVFRGSGHDLISRYYECAKQFGADIVVRITSDCPLVDPKMIDQMILDFQDNGYDFMSNNQDPTFPDGLDIEIIKFALLDRANNEALTPYFREHVTPFFYHLTDINTGKLKNKTDLSLMRWTVDEEVDFEVVSAVFMHFYPNLDFSWTDVLDLSKKSPEMFEANAHISRNEGHKLSAGQKLWRRAKAIIPGGNMLLSKRPERFLPGQWPTYFSQAKGCEIWDLDGKKYIDMSIMGIGTNILGYGDPEVDDAVATVIAKGNMCSLNCPEEVYLVEKLIQMHPWASGGRLARTGGEANSIAIRLGRAASGRDKVAFCGYHGWHDWYLSSNLADTENLNGHLLPGLQPKGVPKALQGTSFPFRYNDLNGLIKIMEDPDVGTIKMEVCRNEEPESGFLQEVRDLATKKSAVLIFDECTSGFRETFGGLHKKYAVEPDVAMFGKAMGNGYAITAVIGRASVMDEAQDTFISSTFWTERIGPTAALATLEVMERNASWNYITEMGGYIRSRIGELAHKHNLQIVQSGLRALTSYKFISEDPALDQTFVTQEMLKRGFLSGDAVYVSTVHSKSIIDDYLANLDEVFFELAFSKNSGDVKTRLQGGVASSGFTRLA